MIKSNKKIVKKLTYQELEHELYIAIDTIMDYQHRLLSIEKILNSSLFQYAQNKRSHIDDKELTHKEWEEYLRKNS